MYSTSASTWTCSDVEQWLIHNGFQQYSKILCDKHKIDGKALLLLNEDDLKTPPLQLKILGDIKRLYLLISTLQTNQTSEYDSIDTFKTNGKPSSGDFIHLRRRNIRSKKNVQYQDSTDINKPKFEREIHKTVISFVYAFVVALLTAFVMVVVHDRVPDMTKYPPLPDIFLDSVPMIPWAFQACEMCGLILASIFSITIFIHKHRFIVLRRCFALLGTVFLLRCVTMFVTSLSVPGIHLQCAGKVYGDIWTKLNRAFEI
ncbi:sphingomyelin synthase-related protein 1-like isoform X1 [Antedon mediterranea]